MRRSALLTVAGATALVVLGTVATGAVVADGADDTDGNVTMYRAADVEIDGLEDLERGIADGSIENASAMLETETLVVKIDDERLAEYYDTNVDSTEDFFESLRADGRELRLHQAETTPEQPPLEIQLGTGNTTVYRNGSVTYAVVDATITNDIWRPNGGEFGVAYGSTVEPESPDNRMRIFETKAEIRDHADGEPLPAETIRREVDVNIPADRTLEARLELGNGETRTATVESVIWSSGSGFAMDLQDVDPGTEYTLTLRHDGDVVESYSGDVTSPRAALEVHDVNETVADNRSVRTVTVSVELSHGGVVRATDAETSEQYYFATVEPGENRTWTLSTPDVDEPLHIHLEREKRASERYYPDGSSAAIVRGNGSVTAYEPVLEGSPMSEPNDGTDGERNGSVESNEAAAADESTADDAESSDASRSSDGLAGLTASTAVAAVAVSLLAIRRF